jgi:hypothetical protein
MIAVRLHGGLGNQLFQYAAGLALAEFQGVQLVLDASYLMGPQHGVTPRKLELNHFNIKAELKDRIFTPYSLAVLRAPLIFKLLTGWDPIFEKRQFVQSEFFNAPNNSYLVGHWQSPKLFDNVAHLVFQHLQPKTALPRVALESLRLIQGVDSVGLHIRRGDYVTSGRANKFHGVLPIEYYEVGIKTIKTSIEKPRLFIFSDDIDWCKSNLKIDQNDVIYINSGVENGWCDLYLMSLCRHHIIANSSFSWWASWLADKNYGTSRIVCGPGAWYSHSQLGKNLQMSHWKVIS